jgi:hypothetical protein
MRRWRLPDGPVCASLPNSSGSIPGRCNGSAALSPPQASPSDDREGHEMSGCRPRDVARGNLVSVPPNG